MFQDREHAALLLIPRLEKLRGKQVVVLNLKQPDDVRRALATARERVEELSTSGNGRAGILLHAEPAAITTVTEDAVTLTAGTPAA